MLNTVKHGEIVKVELEARLWNRVEHDGPMLALHRDDYVQFTLSRFFRALGHPMHSMDESACP